MNTMPGKNYPAKHLYAWGLLGIIPIIGAFSGLILFILGITYRDRILSLIGILGILFTIGVYTLLFYEMGHGKLAQQGFKEISVHQINQLAKQIEFYKYQHGIYPENLNELQKEDPFTPVCDPLLSSKMRSIVLTITKEKVKNIFCFLRVSMEKNIQQMIFILT